MNKKALELPVNVLVILIISIIVFGFGIYIINQVRHGTTELSQQVDAQSKAEIERLLQEDNALVATPFNVKETGPGKAVGFGVGVRNALRDDVLFGVRVSFEGKYSVDGRKSELAPEVMQKIERDWLGNFQHEQFALKQNDFRVHQVIIKPIGNVAKGFLYVFNICVYCSNAHGCNNDPGSCTPAAIVYDKVHQVSVQVK